MSNVTVQWGEAGTFWDVYFDEETMARHGIGSGGVDRISVKIDRVTGAVNLNPGYEERSAEYGDELYLFRQNEDEIVSALLAELRDSVEPAYSALKERYASLTHHRNL